jgi:hypothetical protein
MTPTEERKLALATRVDWENSIVTFSHPAENGIQLVNPPTVHIPLQLIMRIASEAIHQALPPQLQNMNLTPAPAVEAPTDRGGRSLAFDANVRNPKA